LWLLPALPALASGVIAQVMARQSQLEQWLLDNRKQEWRELLSSLATTFLTMLRHKEPHLPQSPEAQSMISNARLESARILHDRIFIRSDLVLIFINTMTYFRV
jgi:hypothetical protein